MTEDSTASFVILHIIIAADIDAAADVRAGPDVVMPERQLYVITVTVGGSG